MKKLNTPSVRLDFILVLLAIGSNVLAIDRVELLKQYQQAELNLKWYDAHIAVIEDQFKTGKLNEHEAAHVLYRNNTLELVAGKRVEFALLASQVAALDQDKASDGAVE